MKKNSLSTAVIAGITGVAGLASVANAVNVNPDGLGQVLLYPYYTVNGGNQTLISIVNTTNQSKAVKVRFLESLNSAEVLDFNLYLSPFDVWTAAVLQTDAGAAVLTGDTSCTVPLGVGKDWVGGAPGVNSAFVPFEFENNNPDIIGTDGVMRLGGPGGALTPISAAERMRQGHIEVIEMGVLFNEGAPSNFNPAAWATHTAAGTPSNCGALSAAWNPLPAGIWTLANGRAVNAPSGGLFGGGTIVDVAQGRALTYNADAIDGFFRIEGLAADADGSQADLHSPPGDIQPNLTRARTGSIGGADVATANIFDNGDVVTATFAGTLGGVNAVSAALMARYIYNEFNMEAALNASSEWVITFPTKRLHTYGRLGLDVRPFTDNSEAGESAAFQDGEPFDTFGSCETYTINWWNREELTPGPSAQGPIISPPPPSQAPIFPQLCWESNVLAFNQTLTADTATAVLGATPRQGAHGLNIGNFTAGWARIQFDHPNVAGFQNYLVSDDANPIAIVGLPVIGFWAADYVNANVAAGVRANYSGIHKHRADRDGYRLGVGAVAPAFGTGLNTTGLSSWTTS